MKQVTFVTGNQGKWEIARDIFAEYGIELIQEKLDTSEIQALDVEEVSVYSATYAEPGREPIKFISKEYGSIAQKAEGEGSTFDKILILEGFERPKGIYSREVNLEHFKNHLDIYREVAKYLGKI